MSTDEFEETKLVVQSFGSKVRHDLSYPPILIRPRVIITKEGKTIHEKLVQIDKKNEYTSFISAP